MVTSSRNCFNVSLVSTDGVAQKPELLIPSGSENDTERKKGTGSTNRDAQTAQNQNEEQKSSQVGERTLSLDWLGKIHALSNLLISLNSSSRGSNSQLVWRFNLHRNCYRSAEANQSF